MIKSVKEYTDEIDRLAKDNTSCNFLYRGQADADWEIKSTLERSRINEIACDEYYREVDKYKPLLNPVAGSRFERKFDRAGYNFNFDTYEEGSWELPEMEYLAYLRHHGFPTPLIDWSASPYVALFFACEDFCESETNGKVYVYLPPKIKFGGSNVCELRHIGKYVEAGKRHFAQQSEYLIPIVYHRETVETDRGNRDSNYFR